MSIHFQCPQCGHKLKANETHAGKRVQCSHCAAVLTVPSVAGPATTKPPPRLSELSGRIKQQRTAELPPDEPPLVLRRPADRSNDEIDMTPMIDVVFQLLIFFMVTAAFGLQKSISLPTPDASSSANQARTVEELEDDDDYVIVRVDQDNTIWVNDSEAPSEQELLAKLRTARKGSPGSDQPGPNKLLVLASGDAEHGRVVTALDAGTAAGMEDIRLATVDDDY
jgi:biopolymer transport protein ExbD